MLENINTPSDIKSLSVPELEDLIEEIRKYIIETVSERGGHLASSLGCVEIIIALHYTFDAPKDKILWDVGHQTYAHKIVTGRREEFKTLREYKGISGFPNIFESEHDAFGVGHAGTAISAALGFAAARDIRGDDNFVISVVGDGAISAGMAFEGVNQSGHMGKDKFIVVLNDNEMSISKNVGALAKYLTRITTGQLYLHIEKDIWELMGKIPTLGGKAQKIASKIKESIKNLIVPNMFFEDLGFNYFGPVDGNNLSQLINTFSNIKKIKGPVFVHTVTKKGKGYSYAEENAEKFHGIGGFYKSTGGSKSKSAKKKYSNIFGETIMEIAKDDEKVVVITAAMKSGTGLVEFAEEFPDRFFDVGICEQHAVTFAAGLAREGYKPFVDIYSTFLQRSFDQIIHDVALQKLPVRFLLDRAGIVGKDGPTHHGNFDLGFLRMIPQMVLMASSDEEEMRRMVYNLYNIQNGPSALRFPRGRVKGVEMSELKKGLEFGKGVLVRKGKDLSILAVGTMVDTAVKASDLLREIDIDAGVANARFIKPIDRDLVITCCKGGIPIFTLEENAVAGGFGDAVSEVISEYGLFNSHKKIGIPDKFIPHGARAQLLDYINLTPEGVADIIRSNFKKSRRYRPEGNKK
ncbi:MAG TPA: 1-deoxy-D-xylulose-5-phosphate synthase [Candidatus Krumholzibacteriaceae bacterium]|nr:1-deoxy-D-xylulose-5-phosphate synthase [Candidatus Krumholzibacteriaceae bacterium]